MYQRPPAPPPHQEEDVGFEIAAHETSKGKGGGKQVAKKKKKDAERQQPSPSVEAPRASLPQGQLADLLFIFDACCKVMTNAFPCVLVRVLKFTRRVLAMHGGWLQENCRFSRWSCRRQR